MPARKCPECGRITACVDTRKLPGCCGKCGHKHQTAEAKGSAVAPGYTHKDMEHWAEEYECAMKHVDDLQVPRHDETKKVFSLVGRINKAISLASA